MTAAIKKCRGNIYRAALSLKVDRATVYRFLRKHKSVLKLVEDSREAFIDDVETALHDLALGKFDKKGKVVIHPSATAGIFILKTRAKRRGYIERSDLIPASKVAELTADLAGIAATFARPEMKQECLDALQRIARAHLKQYGLK